MVYCIVITCIV